MRNDRHEPNGAKKQRPERIPIDPEHRSYSRNATAAVAIDSLLQNSGRREHDYATRRIRHLGAGLRIAVDTLTFLDFSCHSSVSLQFRLGLTRLTTLWAYDSGQSNDGDADGRAHSI